MGEIEKLQLYLDIISNAIGMGAVCTGAFGMNILSGLEAKQAFVPACAIIAAVSVATGGLLRWFVHRGLRQPGNATVRMPALSYQLVNGGTMVTMDASARTYK